MKTWLTAVAILMACAAPVVTDGSADLVPPAPPPKLTKYVQKANPELGEGDARRIAYLVESAARRYDMDKRTMARFASIIRQESRFHSGIKVCHGRQHGCDYGIAQVNAMWIEEYELDIHKLRYDDEYNIDVAARILSGVVKRFKRDPYAYSYYHNADPEKRVEYQQYIESAIPKV